MQSVLFVPKRHLVSLRDLRTVSVWLVSLKARVFFDSEDDVQWCGSVSRDINVMFLGCFAIG